MQISATSLTMKLFAIELLPRLHQVSFSLFANLCSCICLCSVDIQSSNSAARSVHHMLAAVWAGWAC